MKRNYVWPFIISIGIVALPFVAGAQVLGQTNTFTIQAVLILNRVIAIAVLIAFLFFVWGIAQFIRNADEPAARDSGRQKMIWGVIALAVLVSVWGLVWWLQREFNITQNNTPNNIGDIYRINPQ